MPCRGPHGPWMKMFYWNHIFYGNITNLCVCDNNSITNNYLKPFINAVTYLKDIATYIALGSKVYWLGLNHKQKCFQWECIFFWSRLHVHQSFPRWYPVVEGSFRTICRSDLVPLHKDNLMTYNAIHSNHLQNKLHLTP